ncbi:unnamed protein product [Adineta steineri]|uniref:G-protein coupled receptors family 1 profile domain-containing protein n=1 Tax=Adineta steineri TaxID=433720 RepID=A0A819UQV7_9BILA|nr:unnamed protein product [Adineta steineri]
MSSTAIVLNNIYIGIATYYLPVVFVIGLFTNVANILIFSYGRLRTNICSWYFICLSISQILILFFSGLYRMIVTGWNNGYDYSQISMDLFPIGNPSAPGFGCGPTPGSTYQMFYLIYTVVIGILPLLIMIVLVLLIKKNLRNRGRGIHPSTNAAQHNSNNLPIRQSRNDFQLIRLSLIQILCFILFNVIYSLFPLYYSLTMSQVRIGDRVPIEMFISNIGQCILVTYAAVTFTLYILASSVFRQEFKERCKRLYQHVLRIINNV